MGAPKNMRLREATKAVRFIPFIQGNTKFVTN